MSNEFEFAYWLAHHKRILDLAVNVLPREKETTSMDQSYYISLPKQLFTDMECSQALNSKVWYIMDGQHPTKYDQDLYGILNIEFVGITLLDYSMKVSAIAVISNGGSIFAQKDDSGSTIFDDEDDVNNRFGVKFNLM
ncbi:hypothetical protein C1646_753974 [Rhizophagus diaphanus]|nr:hypothetical protein C1646_753974 [Rhizophagus diaphanus] [Rhizophagus sp. MUCL 43196]